MKSSSASSNSKKMMLQHYTMMFLVGCFSYAAASRDKVYSSFCSSLGMMQSNPSKSCDDIYQINKASRGVSTHCWIKTTTGVHQVYCDMELECGGHKGGWMRIADLDTSRGDACPIGWRKITTPDDPTYPSKVACQSLNGNAGCFPTSFTVNSVNYYKVCGKLRGYQVSTPDGFDLALHDGTSINDAYVDGISITLGVGRKHVWTYAVGSRERRDSNPECNFPCSVEPGMPPPVFVKEHYYCESGNGGSITHATFTNDPLWDGSGCLHDNNNCCVDPSLPWFVRQFPQALQDDIEMRICHDQGVDDEDIIVEVVQLFVQ